MKNWGMILVLCAAGAMASAAADSSAPKTAAPAGRAATPADALDANGDGIVSADELARAFQTAKADGKQPTAPGGAAVKPDNTPPVQARKMTVTGTFPFDSRKPGEGKGFSSFSDGAGHCYVLVDPANGNLSYKKGQKVRVTGTMMTVRDFVLIREQVRARKIKAELPPSNPGAIYEQSTPQTLLPNDATTFLVWKAKVEILP